MVVSITPDPKHPRGGFAALTISGAQATSDPVSLSIFNSYQQKWLGPGGWQPGQADLIARQAHQDGDTLHLILGPDIVNNIEEDTPIRIEIGDNSWDTYWPDDINAGPDEAVVGDIGGTGSAPDVKKPTVVKELPSDPPDPEPSLEDSSADVDTTLESNLSSQEFNKEDQKDDDGKGKSRLPLILGAIAAVLVACVALYFFVLQPGDTEEPVQQAVVTPELDLCGLETLSAQQGSSFADLASKIRDCGGDVSADNALLLVEKAAAANDAYALDLFGILYDNTITDAAIENTIGLTFNDDPARAADYYARAVAAGSTEAPARLQAVCRRLLLKSDTLSQSAREDHCS